MLDARLRRLEQRLDALEQRRALQQGLCPRCGGRVWTWNDFVQLWAHARARYRGEPEPPPLPEELQDLCSCPQPGWDELVAAWRRAQAREQAGR